MRLEYPGGKQVSFIAPRVLRGTARIRYREAVHEQLDVQDAPAALSNISLHHHGYVDPDALVRKEERNLAIAESMPASPHSFHCIVRAAFSLRQRDKTVAVARRLIESPGPPALKREACALAAAASLNLRNSTAMAEFVAHGLAIAPDSVDMHLARAVAALGQYVHSVRKKGGGPDGLFRPPVFVHDQDIAKQALELLMRGSRPDHGATAPPADPS